MMCRHEWGSSRHVRCTKCGAKPIVCVEEFRIGPKGSRSVYIHAARQFVVTEDPPAEQPKP